MIEARAQGHAEPHTQLRPRRVFAAHRSGSRRRKPTPARGHHRGRSGRRSEGFRRVAMSSGPSDFRCFVFTSLLSGLCLTHVNVDGPDARVARAPTVPIEVLDRQGTRHAGVRVSGGVQPLMEGVAAHSRAKLGPWSARRTSRGLSSSRDGRAFCSIRCSSGVNPFDRIAELGLVHNPARTSMGHSSWPSPFDLHANRARDDTRAGIVESLPSKTESRRKAVRQLDAIRVSCLAMAPTGRAAPSRWSRADALPSAKRARLGCRSMVALGSAEECAGGHGAHNRCWRQLQCDGNVADYSAAFREWRWWRVACLARSVSLSCASQRVYTPE